MNAKYHNQYQCNTAEEIQSSYHLQMSAGLPEIESSFKTNWNSTLNL